MSLFRVQKEEHESWCVLRLARRAGWYGHCFSFPEYACIRQLVRQAVMCFGQELEDTTFIRLHVVHHSEQISREFHQYKSFHEGCFSAKRNPAVVYYSAGCPPASEGIVKAEASCLWPETPLHGVDA